MHGGINLRSERIERIEAESPIFIEHLSHVDTAQWIERTNRYTSQADRVGVATEGDSLVDFAHGRIDHWLARSRDSDGNDYLAAVGLLRAIYDMVDRIKSWEAQRGLGGAGAFQARCEMLQRAYDELETRIGIPTGMHSRPPRTGNLLQHLIGCLRRYRRRRNR